MKLRAARRDRIYEIVIDDKEHLKVIAVARLKLEKDLAPVMPSMSRDSFWKLLQCNALVVGSREHTASERNFKVGKIKRGTRRKRHPKVARQAKKEDHFANMVMSKAYDK